MSRWTHVRGLVEVYANGEAQYECEAHVQEVVAHLPIVYGSEENMLVQVVKYPGLATCSSNVDEYGVLSNLGTGAWKLFEYQPRYNLILCGDLRDTYFEQTYKSVVKWLIRLAKGIWVCKVMINISEEYGKSSMILSDENMEDELFNLSIEKKDNLLRTMPERLKILENIKSWR